MIYCPICKNDLIKNEKSLKCKFNHTFDISKEGYVNLLPANKKNSLNPGDNKEMTRSRNEFLNKDFYLELLTFIKDILKNTVNENTTILDCGCGTGYYIDKLQKELNLKNAYGVDISKYALKYATKQNKHVNFFVASLFDMPIKDKSVDVIINIFAPKAVNEFKRILKPEGIILEVLPNTNHLIELKKILYKENTYLNPKPKNLENFSLKNELSLSYSKTLTNSQDILNLFFMTPYLHTTKKEDIEKLSNINNIDLTFDFLVKIYSN